MMNPSAASANGDPADAATDLIVLGTSGHARSCLDVLLSAGAGIHGCVGSPPSGDLQAPYLGTDDELPRLLSEGFRRCIVAVGDNAIRKKLCERMLHDGFKLCSAVSPHAYLAPTARLGAGSVVMHGAIIGPYSLIGTGCVVNTGASVDHDCKIGDYSHVAPGSHLAGNVTLETGAFLGVGSSVIPETTIGAWTRVGAGAVVTRDITLPGLTVVGVPAEEVRKHSA